MKTYVTIICIMFSDLPDSDANNQVLLLGITRLDTPSKSSTFRHKSHRPFTYPSTHDHHYQCVADPKTESTPNCSHNIDDKCEQNLLLEKPKKHFSIFFGRFHRSLNNKEIRQHHEDTNQKYVCNADDDYLKQTKCKKKKSKSDHFKNCIPYCTRKPHDDSLTSSFRITESCTQTNVTSNQLKLKENLDRLRKNNLKPIKTDKRRLTHRKKSIHNNNCNLFNNLNNMDRSVDSIGSCSLDVDAESTDFSGSNLMDVELQRNE